MSKKKYKRHSHSSQHSVPSDNITQKDSSVIPSVWGKSFFEKVKETSPQMVTTVEKVSPQVVQTLQYTTFGVFTLSRINTDVFDCVLVEWRNRFSGGSGNGINERSIVGALIIKECYSYSDKELVEKLASDSYLRDALRLGHYFDNSVFTEAYVSFGQIIYKHYKNTSKDIISESLLEIAHNGEINIRIAQKDVIVNCSHILLHIIHKNIYRFMHNALNKCYKDKRFTVDYNKRNQVEDYLQASYDDVIFASNPPKLLYRLDAIGDLSYGIIQRLKIKQGNNSQLKNYFDKYFKVVNNKVSLKRSFVANPFVYKQIGNILGALQAYSAKNIFKVDVTQSSQNKKTTPKLSEEIPICNINLLLFELQRIKERISTIEQKMDSMSKTIEHQFNTLTPFEKQLSRLETLYRNIDGLDNRIIMQEESLKSMVEKHLQITLYTQELSKTSKDIYELMKLVLMDFIITKSNI